MSDFETRINRPFKFNFRGHNLQPTRFVNSTTFKPKDYSCEKVVDGVRGIRSSEEIDAMLAEQGKPRQRERSAVEIYGWLGWCHVCSERINFVPVEGKPDHYHIPTRCKYPNGIPSFDIKIDVPSGKMVFLNDCRDLFDVGKDGDLDHEGRMGVVKVVKAYEKVGMAHFLVGNSCPGIYKMKGGKIRVATFGNGRGGRRVGSVCTDLWWVCALDYDLYLRLHAEKKTEPLEKSRPDLVDVVTVQPGTYAFLFDPNKGCEFTACEATLIKRSDKKGKRIK